MRHFIYTNHAACSPQTHALGVFVSTFKAMLVAFTGLALRATAGKRVTLLRAIALASVAVAAHHHLISATSAKKHASRLFASGNRKGIEHGPPR
jgi:hypothetical protein